MVIERIEINKTIAMLTVDIILPFGNNTQRVRSEQMFSLVVAEISSSPESQNFWMLNLIRSSISIYY